MENRIVKVMKRTAAEVLGLIIAAAGWVLNLFGLLPKNSAIGIVIVGTLIFGIYAFKRTYEYEETIDAFENSRPILIPTPKCGVYPVIPINELNMSPYVTATTHTATTNVLFGSPGLDDVPSTDELNYERDNQAWFALIYFHNKPIEPTDTSVAKEVSAVVTYYDKECKPKINDKGIDGRWWNNPEVARSNKSRYELERTTIYPGNQGVILALACMGTKDSAIYGYNNQNHKNKDFKKQEFVLGRHSYNIRVVLAGINLKETEFWFTVWHDIPSNELKVKQIEKPDCMS